MDLATTMMWPFLASLVLAGIHVYLGIHVIARKVIFVDLALAQIAALGAICGVLLGYHIDTDPWAVKGFSLAFGVAGAALFSITRMRHERVPHEAVIGIVYAVALASTILATSRLAHGAQEVQDLLAGSILWVRAETVISTALLYALVGAWHWRYRRRLLLISSDPETAEDEGINVRLWDFFFYVSFGVVVTSSVAVAGVLLVFSFLVIPAVVAVLFADGLGRRLAIGWSVGSVVSLAGLVVSYRSDLPSGPTVVACFAAVLAAAGLVHYMQQAAAKGPAMRRVAVGLLAVAVAGWGLTLLEKEDRHGALERLASTVKNERLAVLRQALVDEAVWVEISPGVAHAARDAEPEVREAFCLLVAERAPGDHLAAALEMLSDPADDVREAAVRSVRAAGRPHAGATLVLAAAGEADDYLRVEMAEAALELGEAEGLAVLIGVMDESPARQARRDAHEHLVIHTGVAMPFDAAAPPEANDDQAGLYRAWWEEHRHELRYDPATGRFHP